MTAGGEAELKSLGDLHPLRLAGTPSEVCDKAPRRRNSSASSLLLAAATKAFDQPPFWAAQVGGADSVLTSFDVAQGVGSSVGCCHL